MGDHTHQKREPQSEHAPANQKAGPRSGGMSAEKSAGAAKRIAAAPYVDFGDQAVDEVAFQNVAIFNQDAEVAFLSAQIEGSRAFQIVSKPDHLNPSASGFDPGVAIRVAYSSRARTVDKGFLAVSLQWRDGSSETIRVALQGSAHRGGELSHADEAEQTAAKQKQRADEEQQRNAAEAEEKRISGIEAKGGSEDRRISNAADDLGDSLDALGQKQQNGVTAAADLVATYKRKLPAPPPPDVVIELAKVAIAIASASLSTQVSAGIKALLPSTGAGWTPRKPPDHERHFAGTPGTKETSGSPIGAIVAGAVASKLIETGKTKLTAKVTAAGAASNIEPTQTGAAEDVEKQVEYFSLQRGMVADRLLHSKATARQVKRSLIQFDNPRDAGKAADVLRQAAGVVLEQGELAHSLQAAESTKGWIRLLGHSSLGSVGAKDARARGLKETKDGSSTAQIDHADASKPYDGVVELEFDADAINAGAAVKVSSARLFGVSTAAAKQLQLTTQPLHSEGLAIRARSTQASSPVHVSIARDEAGNVRYTDETGAVGMPIPWLSRRGGRPGSKTSAQQAAKKLIEDLASKTLTQLGVTLETDGTDV